MTDLYRKLHQAYPPRHYDNHDVWAGNLRVSIDGVVYSSLLARCDADGASIAVVEAEVYVRDVDWSRSWRNLCARVWCDANDLGSVDEQGAYHRGGGRHYAMRVLRDDAGEPEIRGNNLVIVSEPIVIDTPGVFHYSVSLSADDGGPETSRRWVSMNDIAHNQDGQIVSSPSALRSIRSVTEVCVRKVGADVRDGSFQSGTIAALLERLDRIQEDVIYLLPFFAPGHLDAHTGEDVRKGELGSVYAPKDFFAIDPDTIRPSECVDFSEWVESGLLLDTDLDDLLDENARARVTTIATIAELKDHLKLEESIGGHALQQLVGRGEMRLLVRKAHDLGKRVIFDLILMQTSRDHPLIDTHPEWYVLDEEGRPSIHRIAWFVYSDVALLDLTFNKPLQNYLSGIAPYWIERCGFDGVRIDASQTVDRPFLKEIKNRIHLAKRDAVVLGETLCALEESRDIPVDMVYALFVDFHRDLDSASQLIDFVGATNASFARGTVAMAYFENHDSARATKVWRERYAEHLERDPGLADFWREQAGAKRPEVWMSQLKGLQASLINATIGHREGTRTIYGAEWGTTWGSEDQTDFENPTLVREDMRGSAPGIYLVQGYALLHRLIYESDVYTDGLATFFPPSEIDDPTDKVLAYQKRLGKERRLVLSNLDHQWHRTATLSGMAVVPDPVFNTYRFSIADVTPQIETSDGHVSVTLKPLQSLVLQVINQP